MVFYNSLMEPTEFTAAAARTARRFSMDLSRSLVMVSGGPDSVALLRALVELDPLGSVAGFEAVGSAGQIPPTLDLGAANQLAIQPVAPTEPVLFEDPTLFEDPFLFEGGAYFEDSPVALEDPPVALEEEPLAYYAGPIATTNATGVEVEDRGDGGRRGQDRIDIDRGGGDDGRDLGPA